MENNERKTAIDIKEALAQPFVLIAVGLKMAVNTIVFHIKLVAKLYL